MEETLKHVQLLRNLRIKELLGNCLESKKLLEKKKVDRNTRSCQKVAEQLAESPSQCNSWSTGVINENLVVPITSLAAAFGKRCNLVFVL